MRAVALVVLVACWKQPVPPRPPQHDAQLAVHVTRLANGLRVVTIPDANAAEIQVTMRYGFGNAADGGHAGIAHLVEHLMYQPALDGEALFARLEKTTSAFNGFTEVDTTTFTERAPPAELAGLLLIEAARLRVRCESIPEATFVREREVVRNELREKADTLAAIAALHTGMFPDGHAYHYTPDTPDSVGAITREQACAFAEAHYVPEAGVLVVAGPVTREVVERAAGAAFASIPARSAAASPAPGAVRAHEVTLRVPLDGTAYAFGWPLPADVADRARVRALVAMLAEHVDADIRGYVTLREVGGDRGPMIALVVVPATDESLVETRRNIAREIEELVASIDNSKHYDDSFDHAQRVALRRLYATLEDGAGRDTYIADHVLGGRDPTVALATELRALATLDRPTASKLARTAIALDAASIVTLAPASPHPTGAHVALAAPVHDGGLPSLPDAPAAAHAAAPTRPAPALARVTTRTLANGMHVVLMPLGSVPTVDIRVVIAAGTGDEPAHERGIALVAAHALTPAQIDIADALEFYTAGGSYDRHIGLDHTTFATRGLERDLDHLLVGLERLLRNGDYRAAPNVVERMRAAAGVRDPDVALEAAWRTAVFGTDHPYAAAGLVREASFPALDAHTAGAFRAAHYRPDATTLIIAGGFDPALADHWVDYLFAGWTTDGALPARPRASTRILPASLAAYAETPLATLQIALPIGGSRAELLLVTELVDRAIADVRHQLGASYNLDVTLDDSRLVTQLRIAGYVDASRLAEAVALVHDRIDALRTPSDATATAFVAARRRVLARLQSVVTSSSALADRAEIATVAGRPVVGTDAEAVRTRTLDQLAPLLATLDLSRGAFAIRGPRAVVERAYQTLGRTPQPIER